MFVIYTLVGKKKFYVQNYEIGQPSWVTRKYHVSVAMRFHGYNSARSVCSTLNKKFKKDCGEFQWEKLND